MDSPEAAVARGHRVAPTESLERSVERTGQARRARIPWLRRAVRNVSCVSEWWNVALYSRRSVGRLTRRDQVGNRSNMASPTPYVRVASRTTFAPSALLMLAMAAAGLPAAMAAGSAVAQAAFDAPSVIVAEVEPRDVTPSFFYVGRVETLELVARVEGFLERRDFREGGHVEKGDLLFLIEQAPYRIAVEQREADLAGARATLENAEEDFARKETLVERKTLARSALGTARAAVQQAQASLRCAKLDLSYTEVASPIAGQISRAAYSVGAFVRPGDGALATVTSTDPVHVTIAVPEKDLIEARRQGIDLEDPPVAPSLLLSDGSAYAHAGEFDYLDPSVDQATDTVLARAVFPNPDRVLLPGQFVTVIVRQKQPVSAVVIPQAAVQKDQRGHFVLVVDRADRAVVRRVVLGEPTGAEWVVSEGLAEGERVVVQGLQKIRPDIVVNPVEAQG